MSEGKQLGQLRPADTNSASIYTPATGIRTKVTSIWVCNVDSSAHAFRLAHDDNGASVSGTQLFYDTPILANETIEWQGEIYMNDPTGNIMVRTDSADDLIFTVYGLEEQVGG